MIVIGSGGAGLAAAISAREAGAAQVAVVEKMPVIGGNTLLSSGVYNAPDPALQQPLGIEDSTALFFFYESCDPPAPPGCASTPLRVSADNLRG